MYLQLSENGNGRGNAKDDLNPYVFIPDTTGQTRGFYVREDNFDDLTDNEWNELMNSVSRYQPQVRNGSMSEDYFLSNRAERRARRKERQDTRAEKKKARVAIKNAKADSIKSGQRGQMVSNIFGAIKDTASSIFGGKPSTDTTDTAPNAPDTYDGGGGGETKPEKPQWMTYALYGGLAIVVIGGIAYVVHKNKKRKRKSTN